jgi:hypothetical protein
MDPIKDHNVELEIEIEELEPKIAPSAGEVVLPLPRPAGGRR